MMRSAALPETVTPAGAGRRSLAAHIPALLLVLAIGILHALQLRPGHDWADDYAMYVAHGLNLLADLPYGDTGFVPNPWSVPGPPTYPPVYPVLVMPLLAIFGTDLHALKIFGVTMLGASLLVAYALWQERLGRAAALTLVAVLGFSPFFAQFRDEVRPDTLFLFFFLLGLWLGDRWTGLAQPWDLRHLWRGVILGLVAYLAYGTRSLGIVLLPALWLVEIWRLRRPGPVLLVASSVVLLLAVLQSITLHADSGYAGNLTLDPQTLAFNARHYTSALSVLWTNSLPDPWGKGLRALLFVATLGLAVVGYLICLRRGPTVLEVVPWFYFAPLVMYWVGHMIQQRYVLPLWPLLLYYAWVGGTALWRRSARVGRPVFASLGLLVLVAFASTHARSNNEPISPGTVDGDALQLYAWLRERSPPDAVVLSGRARAFALYAQRRAVSPFGYRDSDALWRLIDEHRVTHLVLGLGPVASDMDYEHPDDLGRFVADNADRLSLQLQTRSLALYRIEDATEASAHPATGAPRANSAVGAESSSAAPRGKRDDRAR